ncbi:SAM-dependent methyltransferase [Mycolicibacterium agri]|uniref:S-adenosyl-L-methionine-dependent methyltransferase n=1 Tax=Mycolicibacterium agri TaxID=36811 RepID=A0A2A7NGC7_MYCAG|nr:SAM-dependent methyltransferase [Mycolicibacterium agri]PEG42767.1 SAM-dependent methyltransferase [Mycolicibacterium agri]GFG52762.1 putative S-adenosyl-L-methionine-dependent methyltransferase [Mycolicibacterium agri]
MARTDDDSWDITESVGATALGVAWARSQEASSQCPLFTDPFAKMFVDAAVVRGWQPPPPYMAEQIRSISGYAAARTKWFDEFFIAAGAGGIDQAVVLAAGLDARPWRLPWNSGTTVYEIDQPGVLEFKAETLRANDIKPATNYVAVPVDLRQDWPKALQQAGFDPSEPTAWAAEGLLPYLPADAQDLLFERIANLSATGSRVAVETFGEGFFDEELFARHREEMRRLREEAGATNDDAPDVMDLWYVEERTDLSEWFTDRGWQVSGVGAGELMKRYNREADEDHTPRVVYLEATLTAHSPDS